MSGGDNGLSGCRVLIVEDEYFLANDLEKALKSKDAIVIGPISDFEAACHQVKHDGFDVAIVDVNLRGKKAYLIADELIQQGIPFVFYTGYDAEVIPERFATIELWPKPLDPSELIGHIEHLCRHASRAGN